jgi:hypothetical protein
MSSSRQGFLRDAPVTPALFRLGINLWPPFRGAGIRVTRVSADYREIDVTLRVRLLNRNCFGTQLSGSLYAMTDPFHALMMFHNLGRDDLVWDRSGSIRYEKPGRTDAFARFRLDAAAIDEARAATPNGDKHEPTFRVDVVDTRGDTIAVVHKTLPIRRQSAAPHARRGGAA